MSQIFSSLFEGFGVTLELFVLTLLLSLPLGLIISFGSMSKIPPIKWIVKTFVWIIRGTPLMLQLIVFFYGPGLVGTWAGKLAASTGSSSAILLWLSSWHVIDRFASTLVMFSINYACYFSEIYRGGIESIPHGQYEACQVLGMTKSQTFFRVILLQIVKRILPPIGNEVITLVKDTSLSRVISVYELTWAAEAFIKSKGLMWPLLMTGVFYLLFNGIVTVVMNKLEKRLDYYKG